MTLDTANVKPTATPDGAEHTRSGVFFQPNVDIIEYPEELVLLADVPGASANDVELKFEDGALTIHAKVAPRQNEQVEYRLQEYGVGDFYRTFQISEAIDASKISADMSDGVLRLHLPKAEAVKPHKIAVKNT